MHCQLGVSPNVIDKTVTSAEFSTATVSKLLSCLDLNPTTLSYSSDGICDHISGNNTYAEIGVDLTVPATTQAYLDNFLLKLSEVNLTLDVGDTTHSILSQFATIAKEAIPSNTTKDSVASSLSKIGDLIGKIDDPEVKKDFSSYFENVVSNISESASDLSFDLLLIVMCAGSALHFACTGDKTSLVIFGICIIITIVFSPRVRNCVFDHIMGVITKISGYFINTPTPEDGIDIEILDDVSMSVVGMLGAWTTFVTGKSVPEGFLRTLTTFDRSKKTFSQIVAFILKYVEKLANWVRSNWTDLPGLRFITSHDSDIHNLFERIDSFYSEQRELGDPINEHSYQKVLSLFLEIKTIQSRMTNDPNTSGIRVLVRDEYLRLSKLKTFL
jgi:hypothetical protein